MIIRKVIVENFMCYYGENKFEFSSGLNIVLGENGEGKTTLFEAIDWLLKGGDRNLDIVASPKRLAEIAVGEEFSVRVGLEVDQYGEIRYLNRSFTVRKEAQNDCSTSNSNFEGIEENKLGERSLVDAERLLDQVFPSQIRQYSLFKGEAELNIFENEYALLNLINLFSDAKHYSKYADRGKKLVNSVESSVKSETSKSSKNQKKYNELDQDLEKASRIKSTLSVQLDELNEQIVKIDANIQKAAKHVDNASALETINKKIENIEWEITQNLRLIKERYTTYLFDNNWILAGFEPFFNQFREKVNSFSKKKRELEKEFYSLQGEKKGILKLAGDVLPLNYNIPNKEVMEELLRDKHCKVCNTPAPEGSDQFKYMKARLAEYLERQLPAKSTKEELYTKDYITGLINILNLHNDQLRDVRSIKNDISELFDFNQTRKLAIEDLQKKFDEAKEERAKILGNSSGGEERLSNVLKNYNVWQDDHKTTARKQVELENRIETLSKDIFEKKAAKDKIDLESANSFLIKSRAILRDIALIFEETKENKFDEFLAVLQAKSNDYFQEINSGAFTGTISFTKRKIGDERIRIDVELFENDRKLYNPNQSLKTSMHIAVLFAIAKLAEENRQESFPLIMDAPTSSFGETKTGEFLNIISGTKGQIILLIKDFIGTDKATNSLFIKSEFKKVARDKAFWVKLERPFNRNDLSTLNTEVITL